MCIQGDPILMNCVANCRLLLLDMVLGNPDRLPCQRLLWAGNPENLLAGRPRLAEEPYLEAPSTGIAAAGTAARDAFPPRPTVAASQSDPFADRVVAIDARVQRRPPRRLVREEDLVVEKTAELVLNDAQVSSTPLLPASALSCTRRLGQLLSLLRRATFERKISADMRQMMRHWVVLGTICRQAPKYLLSVQQLLLQLCEQVRFGDCVWTRALITWLPGKAAACRIHNFCFVRLTQTPVASPFDNHLLQFEGDGTCCCDPTRAWPPLDHLKLCPILCGNSLQLKIVSVVSQEKCVGQVEVV